MSMDKFFSPKSVAVVGASRSPGKPGHVIFRNFFEGAFEGKVYPVNPKAEELFGQKCYRSVTGIPGPVDLAIIVVPGPLVPQALKECGKKGIHAAVVISAGFKEIGNTRLEEEVQAIAKKHRIRLVGTNCIGIYDPYSGVDTIFNPRYKLERPGKGSIAYISQSGAIGTVMLDWMAMKGYNISRFVSYGNETDIGADELIDYLSKDKDTKVICSYFEGIKDGRKFFDLARRLSRKKPILVQKGGTTAEGSTAVQSHTGSLAGSAEVFSAAFKQAGMIQADDMEEMFDFARILSTQPLPKGKRVQVITDGGGFGVMAVDGIIKNRLELARMGKKSVAELKKKLPPYFVIKNPIDLTGNAESWHYAAAIEAAMKDPNTDMVMVIVLFQVPALTPEVTEVIMEANKEGTKPLVVVASGGRYTEVLKKSLEAGGVPCFSYPGRAAKAMGVLYRYSEYRRKNG